MIARRAIPYPLRAMKISVDIAPFCFWPWPTFHRKELTEFAKEQGEKQWWARWLFFQISYSRWL